MNITFTQTLTRSVDIDPADLVKLMDQHGVPLIEDESIADRFWDAFGSNGELTAAVVNLSEIDDEDNELDEVDEDE